MTADKVALAQHVENDEIKLEALQVRASHTDGSSTRGLICVCFWQIRNKELEIEVMNLKDDNQQVEVRNQHLAMPPSLLRPRSRVYKPFVRALRRSTCRRWRTSISRCKGNSTAAGWAGRRAASRAGATEGKGMPVCLAEYTLVGKQN